MEQGVGGASYGAVNYNGIAKGGRCKDLGRADIFCRKLHNFTPGFPRHGQNIPHGRRRQRASREGESQRFRHTLHGARCSHKGACSLGRAACQFIITDFIRRNFVVSFLSQGYVTRHQRGGLSRPRPHAAAGNKNSRNIHSGRGFQMSRYGLITGGGKNHSVPRHKTGMHFYHITDDFPGCQHQIHPVMSLRASVTNIRHMKSGGMPSFFIYAVYCLLSQLVQVDAPRMAVAIGILYQNLRFADVLFIPSAPQLQGIKLCPCTAFLFTAYSHLIPPRIHLYTCITGMYIINVNPMKPYVKKNRKNRIISCQKRENRVPLFRKKPFIFMKWEKNYGRYNNC